MSGVKNYGSALQTFSTSELFKQFGVEVIVINYYREDILEKNLLCSWCGKNFIKKIILYPTIKKWNKVFTSFYKKNICFTQKIYTYESDFVDFPLDGDFYCVGSDQVWNSQWNKGIINPLYLSFVPDYKIKFAFSSSFGKTSLSNDEIKKTKKFLESFKKISIREESGLNILENQYKIKGQRIIDPTLCFSGEFWKKLSNKSFFNYNYILIYNLNSDKRFDDYARKISKLTGIKLVRLCTRYDQIVRCGKSVLVPNVEDFVGLIANAKYVLTDSFHATAFSINLGVEPICIYPNNFKCRLSDFLELVQCETRHAIDYNDFDVINRHIDFNNVKKILNNERKVAFDFLKNIFECKD